MANLPSEVGYLTVVDNVVNAFSDSSDAGDVPDISQATALVTFTPADLPPDRPFVVVGATGQRVHLATIKAFLANGQLYRVADGRAPVNGETPTTVGIPLVAPNQATLDWIDWHWDATYSAADGEPWSEYTIPIYGVPGETKSVAQATLEMDFVKGLTGTKNILATEVSPANRSRSPPPPRQPPGRHPLPSSPSPRRPCPSACGSTATLELMADACPRPLLRASGSSWRCGPAEPAAGLMPTWAGIGDGKVRVQFVLDPAAP
jgi:hypothetical protein